MPIPRLSQVSHSDYKWFFTRWFAISAIRRGISQSFIQEIAVGIHLCELLFAHRAEKVHEGFVGIHSVANAGIDIILG
jgi:hypothetical protein